MPAEFLVHPDQHVVTPAPLADPLLVHAAGTQERCHEPVPLRRPLDVAAEDGVQLGSADRQPVGEDGPVDGGSLLHVAQSRTEIRHGTGVPVRCPHDPPGPVLSDGIEQRPW
jgi:hypothetical protein